MHPGLLLAHGVKEALRSPERKKKKKVNTGNMEMPEMFRKKAERIKKQRKVNTQNKAAM